MSLQPASVVELCQQLVHIPSVNPDGDPGTSHTGELACAEAVAQFLQHCGAAVQLDEVLPNRPNVIGRFPSHPLPNGARKPRLLFAPHTDTVGVGGMSIDPFAAELRDGRLWGRGASDTKGPMAAMLWALHECREDLADLPVEVHFVGLMSEESAQWGSKHFAKAHGPYDFALVGEPTGMQTVLRHKGCLWADVITRGVAAHGATPERGVNAIVAMARLIDALNGPFRETLKTLGGHDDLLGHSSINLGMIHGGTRSNIVADFCRLRVDLRTTAGLKSHGGALRVLEQFVKGIDPAAEVDPQPETQALNTDAAHPMVQALLSCGSSLTGAPWFCDAAHLAEGGTPGIAIGPGHIAQAHTHDEWIEVTALQQGAAFFTRFLQSLKAKTA
jgi:succinyl-diaminopimelate desuccinylase